MLKCGEWLILITNIIYLNSCFVNDALMMFLFKKIEVNIKDEYEDSLKKFKSYFFKTWFKPSGGLLQRRKHG